jgi:hypothetical protein
LTGTFTAGVQATDRRGSGGGDSKMAARRSFEREWETEQWSSHVLQAVHFKGS